jgi:hypothetical protein
MKCDNEFLKQFSKNLDNLDLLTTFDRNIESEIKNEYRQDALKMIEVFPYYVIDKLHPMWIVKRLEKYSDCCRLTLSNKIITSLKHYAGYLSDKSCNEKRSVCCCPGSCLNQFIVDWPVMTGKTRFKSSSWKQLHTMRWERIECLIGCLEKECPDVSLADVYFADWNQMDEPSQRRALNWIAHKMTPEKGYDFIRSVKSIDANKCIKRHVCADTILEFLMVEEYRI